LLGRDLEFLHKNVNVGELVLAGAGAVGNGFLLGLSLLDVSGTLHIIDPKAVAPGILNRCVWFGVDDVGHSKAKCLASRGKASFSKLLLLPHAMTLGEFVKKNRSNDSIDRLVVTVDSRRARRSLQSECPHEVYDASTTGIDEVVLHFNKRPSELACMGCIYNESENEIAREAHIADLLGVLVDEVRSGFITEAAATKIALRYPSVPRIEIVGRAYDTLFKQLCGLGELKATENRQVLAPFAFVPVLAGAYLAMETVRRLARGEADLPYNYWRVSPWTSPNADLQQLRRPIKNCGHCGNPIYRELEKRFWPNYRLASLP
jgi:hypothetical protein